jgi:diguanylate cyclase (GGDEF)-like protein
MKSSCLTEKNWDDVLSARSHSAEISHERYGLILSRVQFVSRFFGVLILLWVGIEFVYWPWPVSGWLALERAVAAGAFSVLGTHRFEPRAFAAYRALMALLLIPAALILGVEFVLAHTGAHLEQQFGTQAYVFSPLLLVVSLSIFPLTVRESLWLTAPMIPVTVLPMIFWPQLFAATSPMAIVLMLALIAAISAIASLSQLSFLVSLVKKSATDGLTGAVTRKVGERMLDAMFAVAQRRNTPFSVLFIDLDRFKLVNDRFGHGAGDDVLRDVTASIRTVARRQDVLVRWGGEELVLIMPETSGTEIAGFVNRLAVSGIGRAPDGAVITASMGAAERMTDRADGWDALIAAADRRMYAAKAAGRNCYLGPSDIPVAGVFGSSQTRAEEPRTKPESVTTIATRDGTRVQDAA